MRFFNLVIQFLFYPFWILQLLIPRKNNIWLFGGWYGLKYSDNSQCLYEYALTDESLKVFWVTRDRKIYYKLRSEGKPVLYCYSIKCVCYSLFSKMIIISSSKCDVNNYFINGAIILQVWHGVPMKKIGLDGSCKKNVFYRLIKRFVFPISWEYKVDYIISTAELFNDKLASAFNVKKSNIILSGYPRNDVFFNNNRVDFNEKIRSVFNNCKIVYYLPTFRDNQSVKSLFDLSDYDENKLLNFLIENNIVLVSKGHYVERKLSDRNDGNSRIIHLSDDDVQNINEFLKDSDALITDYSGVYFDYLLTGKPIYFASFDIDEYISLSRELYFNYYDEVVCGPIINCWNDFYDALVNEFNFDFYKKNEMCKLKFNKFIDGNSSQRLLFELKEKINIKN